MSSNIPLIDFGPFLLGSICDREQVAHAIDAALSSTGFIYLSNHGISQSKVDECFNWSKRFAALPDHEKQAISQSADRPRYRGYSAIGNEKVREHVCMKESFDFGNPADNALPNLWPSEDILPGFREFMEEFFQDCTELIHHLLTCLSLALKLPSADSLSTCHKKSLFNFSLLHYPALPTHLLHTGAASRIPAHSDFGTLTLLFQDSIGGLQIADPESLKTETRSAEFERLGKFKHVEPVPGTVIVNVGYLLMRWSNGRWKNTIHRVVEPRPYSRSGLEEVKVGNGDEMVPARYSIPFFANPDPETIVEALPGCWSAEVPKRWKAMHVGDYLQRKRKAAYV